MNQVLIKDYLKKIFSKHFNSNEELEGFLSHEFRYFFRFDETKKRLENLFNLINDLGVPADSILDVGCGNGEAVEFFNDRGFSCIGLDLQKEVLLASNNIIKKFFGKKLNLTVADAHKMPFKNKSFNLILLLDVIEHLNNPELFIKSIKKVLARTGHLVVCFPPYYSIFGAHIKVPYGQFVPGFIKKRFFNQFKYRRYCLNKMTVRKFESLVKSFGFSIIFKNMYLYNAFSRRRKLFSLISRIPILNELFFSYIYILRFE